MKTMYFSFFTLLMAGLFFADEKCKTPVLTANAQQFDGPYVQYSNGKAMIRYIMEEDGWKVIKSDSVDVDKRSTIVLSVATDEPGKTFPVTLKTELKPETSEYANISK